MDWFGIVRSANIENGFRLAGYIARRGTSRDFIFRATETRMTIMAGSGGVPTM
jgi:hypothetical protein